MGKIVNSAEMVRIRTDLRREKKLLVFTNGCFDIIHRGHIEYLQKAKALGDTLIVGINTDASVRRIKGEHRPIIEQDDRLYIVSNLSPVDFVCPFDEDTPLQLITLLEPDILVKGADWDINAIVGKNIVENHGGRVVRIDFLPNRSTSGIIERILDRFSKPVSK